MGLAGTIFPLGVDEKNVHPKSTSFSKFSRRVDLGGFALAQRGLAGEIGLASWIPSPPGWGSDFLMKGPGAGPPQPPPTR